MKICIIGTGYVGLVTGTCLAEVGHTVTCLDKDVKKIAMLNRGEIPIYEEGLEDLVQKNIANNQLFFVTDYSQALDSAEAVFIAVGTPSQKDGITPDLSSVLSAVDELAPHIQDFVTIIIKSTVPPNTCKLISEHVGKLLSVDKYTVVSNPEFLKEGKAVEDFMKPSRIVIGTDNEKGKETMQKIYASFIQKGVPIIYAQLAESELIKYASNSFLSVKVGFINEIANLSEVLGLDIEVVAKGIGLDPRIGSQFLKAGPGFGGSCFPKDTQGLLMMARNEKVSMTILESTIQSNVLRKQNIAKKVKDILGGSVKNQSIAILGVTFKANTDDVRHSSSIDLVSNMVKEGANVKIYDPQYIEKKLYGFEGAHCCKDVSEAIDNANLLIIHTDWQEFLELDYRQISKCMSTLQIYDLRNCFNDEKIKQVTELGFTYYSIGRPVKEAVRK